MCKLVFLLALKWSFVHGLYMDFTMRLSIFIYQDLEFFYEEIECIINVNNDLLPLVSHDSHRLLCHAMVVYVWVASRNVGGRKCYWRIKW